jgi:hypothetical protein
LAEQEGASAEGGVQKHPTPGGENFDFRLLTKPPWCDEPKNSANSIRGANPCFPNTHYCEASTRCTVSRILARIAFYRTVRSNRWVHAKQKTRQADSFMFVWRAGNYSAIAPGKFADARPN